MQTAAKRTSERIPKPLPAQPSHDCVLEQNRIRVSAADMDKITADDASPPNDALINLVRKNRDLFSNNK